MPLAKTRWYVLVAALIGAAPVFPCAAATCPDKPGNPLRYVDIFDGPPALQATLTPDHGGMTSSGYWTLAYVYDSGRMVTVRCKYKSGATLDVALPKKVDRCNYRIDAEQTLSIHCK